MATYKLAELLLRRKELNQKVDQIRAVKNGDIFEVRAVRKAVSDSIDDIVAHVPKLTLAEVTAEYDYYAKQLRLVDAAIQQANWQTKVTVAESVMADHKVAE